MGSGSMTCELRQLAVARRMGTAVHFRLALQ
jgi:hypothetical protein